MNMSIQQAEKTLENMNKENEIYSEKLRQGTLSPEEMQYHVKLCVDIMAYEKAIKEFKGEV